MDEIVIDIRKIWALQEQFTHIDRLVSILRNDELASIKREYLSCALQIEVRPT